MLMQQSSLRLAMLILQSSPWSKRPCWCNKVYRVTPRPPWTSLLVQFSSRVGRRRNFTTGRRKVLPFRSIDTTLTTLSLPACNLTIFAMGQLAGLQCSVTRTTSLTLKISELLLNHFVRGWRFAMYSVCQRRQKVCTSFWTSSQRFVWPSLLFVQSSGKARSGAPVKKCPGVNVFESLGSVESWQRGRELRQASIWQKTVFNSSRLSGVLPTILRKCDLADSTPASHKPPKCGEDGGMKFHLHLFSATKFFTFSVFTNFRSLRISLEAPTKFVPLSEKKSDGRPRRAMKRRRQAIKSGVESEVTISRWIAFVAKQTNKQR